MSRLRILLDNGHGNNTPGKRSPEWADGSQLLEYECNRDTVRRVALKLDREGIPYHIITPEEFDVPLATRANRVNALCHKYGRNNLLLLSVHSNASKNHNASGIEVYTSKDVTESDEYAEIFYEQSLEQCPDARKRCDMSDGDHDKEEAFYMLRKTLCPAVLIESYFFDYEPDCRILMSEEGREQIAEWYFESIKKCIELYNQKHQNK